MECSSYQTKQKIIELVEGLDSRHCEDLLGFINKIKTIQKDKELSKMVKTN